MNKEEIKNRIDFNNIQEFTSKNIVGMEYKTDYLVDFEGNFIVPLSPLDVKLIEKIKDLEVRILELEK
jgi:hypothetical protein